MSRAVEVESFVRLSRAAGSPEALGRLLEELAREMGFDHFALVHHVDLADTDRSLDHMRRGEMVALTNYAESWTRAYVAGNFMASDPVVLAAHRTALPFRWEDLEWGGGGPPGSRDFRDSSLKAGIGAGFTVPVHFPGEPAGSCHFSVDPRRALPERNLAMAATAARIAFEAARALVLAARRAGREDCSGRPPRLTERQLQCTLLAGRGLTERESAAALGIAPETVKRHLKEARLAYGVSKTVQLVARAAYDGRIPLADLVVGGA
jgi:LuxR family quorum-sensing system transcriptional regulator CciR